MALAAAIAGERRSSAVVDFGLRGDAARKRRTLAFVPTPESATLTNGKRYHFLFGFTARGRSQITPAIAAGRHHVSGRAYPP